MVAHIFEVITSAVTSFASALSSAVTSITALFYDATGGQMTFLGVLLLIGAGVAVIYFVIRWISSLVRRTA